MRQQNCATVIRRSLVLWLILLVVMLGPPLEPATADQTVSFGAKMDFRTGSSPRSVATGDFILNTRPFVFTLGVDSPTVAAQAGTNVRVTVNIKRSAGFTGNVTVTPPDSTMGIVPKQRDPITTTDPSVTFKLKIKGSASLGPHLVTFTARDNAGHTSAATLTVIVH